MDSAHSTRRFSPRVEFYLRARPKYPATLLHFFQTELHLKTTQPIADIGSGTGFLTELFLRNGNPVLSVEPNPEMRSAAETYLADFPNFHSISATAEATTLPPASVDFVVAGQAFHWFEPRATRKEFLRILKPAGIVALIWNERRLQDSPFTQAYEELIQKFQIDLTVAKSKSITATDSLAMQAFFSPAGCRQRTFDNPQLLDRHGLIDRISSSSYMPLPDNPRYAEMVQEASSIFDAHQHNGTVTMPHDTHVFFGQLS
jgi:SAM-dependent methyltransferase